MTCMDLQTIITVLTGVGIISAIVRSDRQQSKAEGKRMRIIEEHAEQLEEHGVRLTALERTRFMTYEQHDMASRDCRGDVDRKINDNFQALDKIRETIVKSEERRQQYRDEDNKRWLRIETTLARLEERIGH